MIETWRDIEGYENIYQISSEGLVKSLLNNKHQYRKTPLILKPYIDKYGYEIVRLTLNGKAKHYRVHRLVALTYIPNIDNKPCVDHIDRNKRNNNASNLRWVTPKENSNNIRTITHLKEIGIKYKTLYGKQIKNKSGFLFPSIIEAARQLKIPRTTIQNHLKNKTGEWEYV